MTHAFSELRDRCGLDIVEAAAEFGETVDKIITWENGENSPPERVLRALSILADFSSAPLEAHKVDRSLVRPEAISHVERVSPRQRKSQLGQFMTPPSIARFMASLFGPSTKSAVRLLDAGAGEGVLTSAFIDQAVKATAISVAAFEFDQLILPKLRSNLAAKCEHPNVEYEIFDGDFIERATNQICLGKGDRFTHAILNPPYKKIGSASDHRTLLRAAKLETVNLYTGFVGLALELLEPGGELVAIIPRSFCNGPYYQPFRRFILRRAAIQHIHLFDSRNKAFKSDGVLQENMIIKLVRGAQQGEVIVSTSTDDSFVDFAQKQHAFVRIVFPDDADQFVRIPTGEDEQLLERASFRHSLADLGVTVSTGPVVDFRLREDLRADPEPDTVPLLYPGHFGAGGLQWPKRSFKKPNAIRDTPATRKWLYPNGFYAVVRRFSSKEERRRIMANVIDPAHLPAAMIGIENHLNVFHTKRHPIPEDLARGLAAYLNSTAVDIYFRRFNGHTQVNATDLRAMRYPNRDALIALGQWAKTSGAISQDQIDERVAAL
jgi:adenine-specific DNA-methyltransferase